MKLFRLSSCVSTIPVPIKRKALSGKPIFNMVPVIATETRKKFAFPLTKDTLLAIHDSGFQRLVHEVIKNGKTLLIDCGTWDREVVTNNDLKKLCKKAAEQSSTNPGFRFDDEDLMTFLIGEAIETLEKAGIHCKTQIKKRLFEKKRLFIVGEKEASTMQDLSFLSEDMPDFSSIDYDQLNKYFENIFIQLDKGQSVQISQQINKNPQQRFGMRIENGYLPNEIKLDFYPALNKGGSLIFFSALKHALARNKKVTIYQPGGPGLSSHNVFTIEKDPVDGFNITVYRYSDINGKPDIDRFNYASVFALTLYSLLKENIVYLKISRNESFEPQSFEQYILKVSSTIPQDVKVTSVSEPYQTVVSISPCD